MNCHKLKFLGVEIQFPFDPYSIQKCMMSQIVGRLTNKEHGLIESPTGTGKTLVLLCSALAWQKKSKADGQPFVSASRRKRVAEERMDGLKKKPCSCDDLKKSGDCEACRALKAEEKFSEIVIQDEKEEEIISSRLRCKVPRIYYGTRTHKQISQVVRELNKTPYKENLRMCILSSRDRTCINSEVRDLPNRNDKCQELLKNSKSGAFQNKRKLQGETCPYYSDSSNLNALYEAINSVHDTEAWDIEDAAKFGRENRACPYFGIRSLQSEADITFCPYNYLLDPTIRTTLDINLKDAIVIFDEAHNIEDICRDSASFIIETSQIQDLHQAIVIAMSSYQQGSPTHDAFQYFRDKLHNLTNFLKQYKFDLTTDRDNDHVARQVVLQNEMTVLLSNLGFGPNDQDSLKEHLKRLKGDEEEDAEKSSKKDDSTPGLNSMQLQFLTQLRITLQFMFGEDKKYFNDFRIVITKHLVNNNTFSSNNGWRNQGRNNRFDHQNQNALELANNQNSLVPATQEDPYYYKLSILCMNPGIAFEKIHNLAWSVFVASGTLSPIESLKTELGCNFAGTFQGTHVIDRSRVFGSIISNGPTGEALNCSYKDSLSLAFQDEVGRVVSDVCKTVPNGVLVFFPSYDRMENLYQRWVTKGIMKEINRNKKLFREQRKLTVDEFESRLEEYNRQAELKKGALLFAVYRGKVSEGIDFADKAARAVITIGIPYPNIKEITIGLKKEYNDLARSSRPHLMTGNDWYASQAFRALNQALGRCIRHKDDWGAIIMIDSRLNYDSSQKNISRWLRETLCSTKEYPRFYEWLKEFVSLRNEEESRAGDDKAKIRIQETKVEPVELKPKKDELSVKDFNILEKDEIIFLD